MKFWLWLWQMPQNLLGALILLAFGKNPTERRESYRLAGFGRGWLAGTFGQYILVLGDISERGLKHEQGHQRQSERLGWLYLPLVGVPSVCLLAAKIIGCKDNEWYHSHYPENWADRLGGVDEV